MQRNCSTSPRLIGPRRQRGYLFVTRNCRVCVDCKRKLVFHHASLDCHNKNPFPIIFRIKVSFLIKEALRDLNVFMSIQIILYCKLSFDVVAFPFAIKHLISWAISFSKGCSGGGEGDRDAYVLVRILFQDHWCDQI